MFPGKKGFGSDPFSNPFITNMREPNFDLYSPNKPDPNGKYLNFPNNPDIYGEFPQPPRRTPENYGGGLRDFAPPGSIPPIGNPSSPNYGLDGRGGLIATNIQPSKLKMKGDFDEMRSMGILPDTKPDEFDPAFI